MLINSFIVVHSYRIHQISLTRMQYYLLGTSDSYRETCQSVGQMPT